MPAPIHVVRRVNIDENIVPRHSRRLKPANLLLTSEKTVPGIIDQIYHVRMHLRTNHACIIEVINVAPMNNNEVIRRTCLLVQRSVLYMSGKLACSEFCNTTVLARLFRFHC